MTTNGEIAPAVKELRDTTGLSMKQLAALVGVDPMTIHRWEKGLLNPGLKALRSLAAVSAKYGDYDRCRVFLTPISVDLSLPLKDLERITKVVAA